MSNQTSPNIKTLKTYDTIWAADSLEWYPSDNFKNYFICGTYQLLARSSSSSEHGNENDDTSQPLYNRKGRIYLSKFSKDVQQFDILDIIETSAILDMKWLNLKDKAIFSAATSTGSIEIFQVENEKIRKISCTSISDDSTTLALSLDWKNDSRLVVSDSKGDIHLFDYNNEIFAKVSSWHAHGFEAWTCCFDNWNSHIIYTGGDDTFLNVFDLRSDEPAQLTLKNKSHSAGVTTLLSFADYEFKLATGSYDDTLRIFDTRKIKQPINEINLGGGIWRIKPNRLQKNLLLCANMYYNFSVVQFDEGFTNVKVIGEYFEHESICYGCDWSFVRHLNENSFYFATCSMYDHKLNLAEICVE